MLFIACVSVGPTFNKCAETHKNQWENITGAMILGLINIDTHANRRWYGVWNIYIFANRPSIELQAWIRYNSHNTMEYKYVSFS